MEEESLRFWIIPIISLVIIATIFSFGLNHKINTVIPNAAIERDEMKNMDCSEILNKDALNDYWMPENGKIGRAMTAICTESLKGQSSGLSPYVEFCTPGGFAPVKKIDNSTHSFDHDTCNWLEK